MPYPRVRPRIVRGIIALPLPVFGIRQQVLTHKIYAVYELAFRNAFKLSRRNAPTATTVGFGKHPFFFELRRNGTKLLRRDRAGNNVSQMVHSRHGFVFVKGHNARATHILPLKRRFFYVMPRKLTTALVAPIVNLFCEVSKHKALHRKPIFIPESAVTLSFYKHQPQAV